MEADGVRAPGTVGYVRRGGVRVYFCCCPLLLVFALPLLVGRLIGRGVLRLYGKWARGRTPTHAQASRSRA